MAAEELGGEELVLESGLDVARGIGLDGHVEDLGHVGGGLLGVAFDERGVARGLGHLHAVVVGRERGEGAQDEDEAPQEVGLARRLPDGVDCECRHVVDVVEDGRGDDPH
jgi:hypothetical protein